MKTIIRYAVVDSTEHVRIKTRRPRLALNEFAFRLAISIPDSVWGRLVQEVEVIVPDNVIEEPDAVLV